MRSAQSLLRAAAIFLATVGLGAPMGSEAPAAYLGVAVGAAIVALVGYVFADVGPRPNGGTWLGYTLGYMIVGRWLDNDANR